jgi:peptidoglycan/xylan/chitin deacetylase (PgdA/CDA1 family)
VSRHSAKDTLVLCYHAVSAELPAELSIAPARLEAHLELLARLGYRGVTFSEAASGECSGRTVAVTFDDGYRSVLEHGLPILQRLGMPGTVFVATDFVGSEMPMRWPGIEMWSDGPHAAEMLPMDWEELRSLVAAGWEVGSHTCSHPRLSELEDARLREELVHSRAACERALGVPCRALAYPYGDVDRRVVRAADAAGYATAATLPRRLHRPRRLEWPRVGVYVDDDQRRFFLKVSPGLRWLRSTPAWGLVRAAGQLGPPSTWKERISPRIRAGR